MVGQKNGFTILELLAVLAIIAILAGIGFGGYRLASSEAKNGRAAAEIEKLRSALEEFRVEYGRYPVSAGTNSIAKLISALSPEQAMLLTSSVEGLEFLDPWGNAYQYLCNDRFSYSLWSDGLDLIDTGGNIGSFSRNTN